MTGITSYLKDMHRVEFGGCRDALAMSSIVGAVLLTSPFFGGIPVLQAFLAAAGAGYLTYVMLSASVGNTQVIHSDTNFKSDEPPEYGGPNDPDRNKRFTGGFLLGYCTSSGSPVVLSDDLATRHIFMVGMTGIGKTVLASSIMYQQIQRGGGLLFVDGKAVQENLEEVYKLLVACGRERDLLVFNPGDPGASNTYNPILEGTPSEIASRILALAPSTENNAGADYYRSSSFAGVMAIISGLQSAGLKYNFLDISILLTNAKALEELEEKVKIAKGQSSSEYRAFALFLDQFKAPGKQGAEAQLDMKKLKDVFGGLTARMYMFGSSGFGRVMSTYTPEIVLFDAIKNNKIVYVMLPTLGDKDASMALGKMFVADLRSCVDRLYKLPKDQMPNPPFLAFKDEAGSYASDSWSTLYEQARGANIILMPAMQTTANMEAISKNFFETISGNTWTKIFLKLNSQATAEWAADMVGMEKKEERSISRGENSSSTTDTLRTTPEAKSGSGESFGESIKLTEDYRVSPDMLKQIGNGEAFVVMGKRSGHVNVYHIKIPMLQSMGGAGTFRLNRFRYMGRKVAGAYFFENADKYITKVNT